MQGFQRLIKNFPANLYLRRLQHWYVTLLEGAPPLLLFTKFDLPVMKTHSFGNRKRLYFRTCGILWSSGLASAVPKACVFQFQQLATHCLAFTFQIAFSKEKEYIYPWTHLSWTRFLFEAAMLTAGIKQCFWKRAFPSSLAILGLFEGYFWCRYVLGPPIFPF